MMTLKQNGADLNFYIHMYGQDWDHVYETGQCPSMNAQVQDSAHIWVNKVVETVSQTWQKRWTIQIEMEQPIFNAA